MTARVLFIASQPFFQWRGSPIRVGFDVLALAQLGCEVDLLTLPLGERRTVPGVRIIRVPNLFRARSIAIGPSLLKLAFDGLILLRAIPLVLRQRYAVIHAVEDTGPLAVFLAWLGRARLVFEKHSDPSSYHRNPLRNFVMRLYAATERFTIRHADAVIGTGPGLVAQARAVQPRAAVHHIFDIPSSLVEADPVRTAAVAARLRQAPDELLLLYVGSFAVYQGIDLLFEALPHVVRACPRARLVVIGGTPAEVAQRTAWLRARGLEAAVIWAGWVAPDELADYLAAADVLLSPRLSGVNTPLKLLDYLKAGRAIAATDTPANRLILDETTAELAPPEAAAFAAGIVRLLDDPARRAHLATQGRELIRTRYNFAEFKRLLGECYAGLKPA